MAFDQRKYIDEFNKENYDRVSFRIPKGKKKELKDCADAKGISINQLITDALEDAYKIDLSKWG